ncbi:MAG: 4Fe-4S binding protein [Lachnospiraceae bacterium]|nr:4Fe-4S binding protein [Lachnospiraceae bacterium]MDD3415943.1 4Fe-4S binding protein [Lachnospiraceae bacterium]
MTVEECLAILREVKDVSFATVDQDGRPQVRIIDVMLIEDNKLYFCTARGKEFYNQLEGKKYVAITGLNSKFQMIRLNGIAEHQPEQKKLIDRIFEENPAMNEVYPNQSRYILEPFSIENGQIEFFDLGKTPVYRECFSIGSMNTETKGYEINDACIGCGKCAKSCPQQCIIKGTPFSIKQNHCLHCGLCFENCPVGAIKRRGV